MNVLIVAYRRHQNLERIINDLERFGDINIYVYVDGIKHNPSDQELNDGLLVREVLRNHESECICSNISSINNGAGAAVYKAISWFLSEVECGIVLEDDIFISRSGLIFSNIALQRFRDEPHIGYISLCRVDRHPTDFRLGVGNIGLTWGWAVWRDRWNGFERDILKKDFGCWRSTVSTLGLNLKTRFFLYLLFALAIQSKANAWDIQWYYFNWKKSRRVIYPPVNLVDYVGVDSLATHTSKEYHLSSIRFSGISDSDLLDCIDSPSVDVIDNQELLYRIHPMISWFKVATMALSLVIPNGVFFKLRKVFR